MELRTSFVLNTTTQSGSRWGAWLLLLMSLCAVIPASDTRAAPFLLATCLCCVVAAAIFLARSRAPEKGKVSLEPNKIWFDRDWIAREDIVGGYWSPGFGRRGSGVVLLGKDEREIAWIGVEDHRAGDRLLEHLGLGPTKRVVQFDAASTTLLPAVIRLGVDGVTFGTSAKSDFVAWSDVKTIAKSKRGAELELANGARFELPLALRRVRGEELRLKQAALVSLAHDAIRAARRGSVPDMSVQIARNGRAHDEWVKSLVNRDGSFREAPLRADDLWRVVESPAAEATARAGAAAVLAQTAGDADRARLRIAADTCAEPKLRVVLDKAATGEDAVAALGDLREPVPRDSRGLRDLREPVPRDSRGLGDLREPVPRDSRGLEDLEDLASGRVEGLDEREVDAGR